MPTPTYCSESATSATAATSATLQPPLCVAPQEKAAQHVHCQAATSATQPLQQLPALGSYQRTIAGCLRPKGMAPQAGVPPGGHGFHVAGRSRTDRIGGTPPRGTTRIQPSVLLHCNIIHSLLAHGHTRQQERKPAQDWSSSGWSRYRRARQIHRIQRAKHAPSGRRAYPHSSPEHAAIRIWKGTVAYPLWRLSPVELQPVQGPAPERMGRMSDSTPRDDDTGDREI